MEACNAAKHHFFDADSYLKFHLSRRDVSVAAELCQVYRPLTPSLVRFSLHLYFKVDLSDVDRQSVRECLWRTCVAGEDSEDHRLTAARTMVAMKFQFDSLSDIKNSLIRHNPVEFADILLAAGQLVEAIDVINSFLHYTTDLMKLRAARGSSDQPDSKPSAVPVEKFKQVGYF